MVDGVIGLNGHHAVAPVDQGSPKENVHVPTQALLLTGMIALMNQLNTPCVKQILVQVCVKQALHHFSCTPDRDI